MFLPTRAVKKWRASAHYGEDPRRVVNDRLDDISGILILNKELLVIDVNLTPSISKLDPVVGLVNPK